MAENSSEQRIGGVLWTCLRPDRIASALEFSFQEEGLARIGPTFFHKQSLVFRDRFGKIWISEISGSERFVDDSFKEPLVYLKFAKLRIVAFARLCRKLVALQAKVDNASWQNPHDVSRLLFSALDLFSDFHLYAYLSLFDDKFIEKFIVFLSRTASDEDVNRILQEVLKSRYAKAFLSAKGYFDEKKGLNLRQAGQIPVVPATVTDKGPPLSKVELEFLRQNSNLATPYNRIRNLVRTVYEFGQETIFVGRPLISTASLLLTLTGEILERHRVIADRAELTNWNIREVLFELEALR